ncbi:MAG: Hpt domain-containing protein [Bdellovibrionales bacterium]|nr:Hpt domain-containing protein [Bdellovibrionales bacterium]
MQEILPLIVKMRSTYDIFVTELESHLAALEGFVAELETMPPEKLSSGFDAHAKRLAERFHVLKGGSGFLQLKTIASLTGKGEEWFKNGTVPARAPIDLRTELAELVRALRDELNALQHLLKESSPT